jgi:hypothetical protein
MGCWWPCCDAGCKDRATCTWSDDFSGGTNALASYANFEFFGPWSVQNKADTFDAPALEYKGIGAGALLKSYSKRSDKGLYLSAEGTVWLGSNGHGPGSNAGLSIGSGYFGGANTAYIVRDVCPDTRTVYDQDVFSCAIAGAQGFAGTSWSSLSDDGTNPGPCYFAQEVAGFLMVPVRMKIELEDISDGAGTFAVRGYHDGVMFCSGTIALRLPDPFYFGLWSGGTNGEDELPYWSDVCFKVCGRKLPKHVPGVVCGGGEVTECDRVGYPQTVTVTVPEFYRTRANSGYGGDLAIGTHRLSYAGLHFGYFGCWYRLWESEYLPWNVPGTADIAYKPIFQFRVLGPQVINPADVDYDNPPTDGFCSSQLDWNDVTSGFGFFASWTFGDGDSCGTVTTYAQFGGGSETDPGVSVDLRG